ncbi:MAG: diguanylate cyclase, partial [Desulfuromonadales bacterium]
MIILPCAFFSETLALAERLRSAIRDVPFSFANHSWQVTASLGIAITEDQPQRFGLALERADEGLYLAKKRRPRPGGLGRPGTTNFLAARRTRGLSAVSLTGPESSPRS